MMLRFIVTLFLGVGVSVTAFIPSSTRNLVSPAAIVGTAKVQQQQQHPSRPVTFLGLSSSNDEEPQKKRQRRRRKDAVVPSEKTEKEDVAPPSPPPPPPSELKAREDTPVEFEIQDIRNIISGGGGTSTEKKDTGSSATVSSSINVQDSIQDDDDDDDEYEYYYEDDEGNEIVVPDEQVDSLSQLLADARQMREQDASSAASKIDNGDDEEEGGGITVPDSVRNVISTIVTADFFLVCALLLWFLTGIATRSIFDNDTIQIAFNNNFELIVQPALGVLMIGAAAGAVLKEEETG
mmetsp:Transcript_23053/g.32188  ORF Transcript_23053/g.32188 Transcript_23053/m.32188 type:complete len:294 (+) Transcript_23053:176-1057(+)